MAPVGLIEAGGFSPVDDIPELGQGVTLCIVELPASGNLANCGVAIVDGDPVLYEQQARRVTFTWYGEGNDEHNYTSPPALLFDECPDPDSSDPLLHPNVASLPISVVVPTIPALHIDDAITTSLYGFAVRLRQC